MRIVKRKFYQAPPFTAHKIAKWARNSTNGALTMLLV